jgi:hypothetical protein
MSTVAPRESRSTALPAPRDPPVFTRSGPMPAMEPSGARQTPFFTRHMPGTIEAERDRRVVFRATHPRRPRGREAMAHPMLATALAAEARTMTQARLDYSRWANEGGRFDPEAAARLRIGDRAMKRCNA